MVVKLLTDKSRLQEIYELRVLAWENSANSKFINRQYFPDGWKDKFDDDAFHWIIESNNAIIASARVAILDSFNDLDEDLSDLDLTPNESVAFLSRLVVHPKGRGKGLAKKLDKVRIAFFLNNLSKYAIIFVDNKRISELAKWGFKKIGKINHYYGTNPAIDQSTVLLLKKI